MDDASGGGVVGQTIPTDIAALGYNVPGRSPKDLA